jgi:steroid delta-isomerase
MDIDDRKAQIASYIQALGDSDLVFMRELFATDAIMHDPVGSDPQIGIDAILGFYEMAMPMIVSPQLTGSIRCAGDSAAFPLCASINGASLEIIDVFEFNEAGKVQTMRAYWST